MRTLYRRFSEGEFNQQSLPMQGKRKPNGHQEKRGRQSFRRTIKDREKDHPNFENEFGHLESDTIKGRHHKNAVITLVERKSKCIIVIKPVGRQAAHIEKPLNNWLNRLPRNIFKLIIFNCGTEFSNWIAVSNE